MPAKKKSKKVSKATKKKQSLTRIKKRDGSLKKFDPDKITVAVFKATQAIGEEDLKVARKVTEKVVKYLDKVYDGHTVPTVEEVQNSVEKILIEEDLVKVAKSYILYREQRTKLRGITDTTTNFKELVENYIGQGDWRVKENSNMSFSLQGLNNYVSSAISSKYWLYTIYPAEIRDAHLNADMHIHDLGLLSVYCCGWDLKDILMYGFKGAAHKISSKPPKHFRSALGQLVNFFYTLQGEAAGAQALANFDTYLAPFIHYDKLTYEDVKQALQEFVFNMNVPTRVGFQTPFTNITMDVKPTKMVGDEAVIIGGKPKPRKYKEFQKEMDMINRAFAEVMLEGDATGRVFTFPIPTYNITKKFDWDNKALEKMWEMTAKYGVPYFSNFVNSDMDPDDARSMCCRLRLDNRELRKRGGGLFAANPLTGSIGVVTINLPRLGYLAKNKKDLYKRLDNMMNLARQSLDIKRDILEEFTEQGLYPYSKYYLRGVKERMGTYWKNHFNTIGIHGMNECLINFMGKNILSKEGHEMALDIMEYMRARMIEFQKESNNLYNLEATPAEGTSYRFAKKDKEDHPDLICANEDNYQHSGADPYYTNSTHLPVGYTDDLFDALDLQDPLQTLYTGGTVLHGFVGEQLDPAACKKLVKTISDKYSLPYYSITPTFSVCPKHGYLAGEHFYCPKCDEEIGYKEPTKKNIKNPVKHYNLS